MFKSVVWSSTIDYPDELATVLFVGNCGWSCEYCYNKNLSKNNSIDFQKSILPRLLKRIDFINHVVISGGECTLYEELSDVVDMLREHGFSVGIHTNGANFNMLEKIIDKLSFVGMDIKTNDYANKLNISKFDISKSVKLISQKCPKYEFRTTLFPPYFDDIQDIIMIAYWLKQLRINRYVLQEYQPNESCKIKPYTKEQISEILIRCNKLIPTKLNGGIYEQVFDFT